MDPHRNTSNWWQWNQAGWKTSLGVRHNELSWFKGAIYRFRITPKILNPKQFLKY
jgi:hypothetical protein